MPIRYANGQGPYGQIQKGAVDQDELAAPVRSSIPNSVTLYGAVGNGSGKTITAAGESVSSIRSDTGQDWLSGSDSMDLAAFYRAQAHAEAYGGIVSFPKDSYIFSGPGFIHAGVRVDLGGSTVTNIRTDATRFARSNRCFLFGILSREDFDRFGTQGWEQTCDDIAIDAKQLTNVSGTMPSVGDTLLIRTTAASGSPTLPSYTTFNEVFGVSGTTVTLRYPMERAIVAPKIVNYSTITTLKSALVPPENGIGEPHRYYCAKRSSLVNGTLVATNSAALEFNSALDADIDVKVLSRTGQGVYGNGLNRSRARMTGTFGGPKAAIELAVGSALSTIDVDLAYSGEDTDGSANVSGNYPLVQLGEYAEQVTVRGRVNGGSKPSTNGVTYPTANRCLVDLDLVARGATQQAVVFPSNAGTGNRYRGRAEISALATYYALWSAGGGGNNWLDGVTFAGDQSSIHSLRFSGPNLGGARGVYCPEGQLLIDASASGNVVEGYVREGVASAGPNGSQISIKTALGSWPEDDVRVAYPSANITLLARECYGRTVTNTGTAAIRQVTLPLAAPGMYLRGFRDSASFALRLKPNAADIVGSGGAGKYLEIGTDRGYVELRCYVAGVWTLAQSIGTITYEP